jgi:hypothetical protein
MIGRISGVNFDSLTVPRGIPEAAATAELKHRQSSLAMEPVLRGFRLFQKNTARTLVRLISGLFPDDQIEAMLSNSSKFQVRGGVVTDLRDLKKQEQEREARAKQIMGAAQAAAQKDQQQADQIMAQAKQAVTQIPPAQPRTAEIRGMSALQYNVKLEAVVADNTAHLLQYRTMLELKQLEVPVDPEVLMDLTSLSGDMKTRLKDYATKLQLQARQKEQALIAQDQQKLEQLLQTEQTKTTARMLETLEKQRNNLVKEAISSAKVGMDFTIDMAALLEKADDDEKATLINVAQLIQKKQEIRLKDKTETATKEATSG